MGGGRPLCRRQAGLAGGRRALRGRGRALRNAEAAHGQRRAFGAGLSVGDGRLGDGGPGDGAACLESLSGRADERRDRADPAGVAGPGSGAVSSPLAAALPEPGAQAPDPADCDGRLAEAAAAPLGHRARAADGGSAHTRPGAGRGGVVAFLAGRGSGRTPLRDPGPHGGPPGAAVRVGGTGGATIGRGAGGDVGLGRVVDEPGAGVRGSGPGPAFRAGRGAGGAVLAQPGLGRRAGRAGSLHTPLIRHRISPASSPRSWLCRW
ncbi:hypothetical protein G6F22_015393 [Rhizopus arrhizus]|nr:hypothetical protein G6F22_015393 [Rhizopus arrhizus]